MSKQNNLGLIQVYTGNGKGKTTASLGLAFRASGHGFKVCMIQFMKKNDDYGEVKAARNLPNFKLMQVGREAFVDLANPESIDYKLAEEGWELAKSVMLSGQYDIVILDEINVAMAAKLLDASIVAAFLQAKKNSTEVILTGRYAPAEITAIAHLVTEMQDIKHPITIGIPARQGIDF
ncbi:cob(I)yrinic acid a,c-diamide adenosyltransferase [Sporomusa sp.]|uniref:cob(I)yrinic acid a,c-diamide adenosyltransferase n=1 Tax=Sporomusa sp. TaxID=2078658 RepID=UPI002BD4F01F|nr:cob(I)yrinic acid a,c-diamide adenosyltransferase [Sporomusa sp.]HWR45276.1 cob(I)yrinic acid a,c-diamide adenosyltransferase [Sporomusa sp.]